MFSSNSLKVTKVQAADKFDGFWTQFDWSQQLLVNKRAFSTAIKKVSGQKETLQDMKLHQMTAGGQVCILG